MEPNVPNDFILKSTYNLNFVKVGIPILFKSGGHKFYLYHNNSVYRDAMWK